MPRILVVEDDRSVQSMLVDLLQEQGYDVETCRTGREALSRLEARPAPDMMLIDVLIPHVNGFALVEQIRAQPTLEGIPVVMMSGIYRARNHRSDMLSRFDVLEYLDKPLDTAALLNLVKGAVGPGSAEMAAPGDLANLAPAEISFGNSDNYVEPTATEEKREVEKEARKAFKRSAFLLQGSIKSSPVASIVGQLWARKRSGALLLRKEKIKKILYLRDGTPYHAKSNLVGECLGRLLVNERLITPEQCEESIELMKTSDKRQGELLVEMNAISPRNLSFALELQMETKMFEPFDWVGGEYRFNPSALLPEIFQETEWKGPAFVTEGIRRSYNESRLREQMLPILDVPLRFRERDQLPKLRFTPAELKAASRIEDGSSTEELLETLPLDPPATLRVLYTLIALEIVAPVS